MKRSLKNYLCSFMLLAFTSVYAQAQDSRKVAVFDPAGSVDKALLEIVREEISSVVVNTKGYTVLERQLINKVLEENKFQESGLVNDEQMSDIGKRMGADYVFVTTISTLGTNYYISCKMIEVATARIDKQSTGTSTDGINDIPQTTQYIVKRLFGENVQQQVANRQSQQADRPVQATAVQSDRPVQAAAIQRNASSDESYNPDGIELIYVEGNAMDIISFYIGKYEITQAQWTKIMGNNPSYDKGEKFPVESVSWEEVQAFIHKLNILTGRSYRLPTDSEWSYAAKGGKYPKDFMYAGSNNINDVARYWSLTSKKTQEKVGTRQPNTLGIYDMTGNVWEWCHDYYRNGHIIRGGSWADTPKKCQLDFSRISHVRGNETIGFRLVLSE